MVFPVSMFSYHLFLHEYSYLASFDDQKKFLDLWAMAGQKQGRRLARLEKAKAKPVRAGLAVGHAQQVSRSSE